MKLFETIEKPVRKLIAPLAKRLEKLVPGKKPDFYSHVVVGALLMTLGLIIETVSYLMGSGIARYQDAVLAVGFFGTAWVVGFILAFYEGIQSMLTEAPQREVMRDIKNYGIGVGVVMVVGILSSLLLGLLF